MQLWFYISFQVLYSRESSLHLLPLLLMWYTGYLTGSEFYYNKTYCLAKINRTDVCGVDFRDDDHSIHPQEYSTFLYVNRTQQLLARHADSNPDKVLLSNYHSMHLILSPVQFLLEIFHCNLSYHNLVENKLVVGLSLLFSWTVNASIS